MISKDSASRPTNDLESLLLTFLRTKVNSFVKWDMVRFFHDNPHAVDTAENIALYTGREVYAVENALVGLVEAGVLEVKAVSQQKVYMLAKSPEIRDLINKFVLACDDREFRIKAISHVIQGMR